MHAQGVSGGMQKGGAGAGVIRAFFWLAAQSAVAFTGLPTGGVTHARFSKRGRARSIHLATSNSMQGRLAFATRQVSGWPHNSSQVSRSTA
jgi:hypothetical protein